MHLSNDEQAMVADLADRQDELLDRTLGWSAINSGSRNIEGLARMRALIRAEMETLGGVIATCPPSPVERLAADGTLAPLDHGANLHFRRDGNGARVLLVGHMDTVFGPEHPFRAPVRLDAERVCGPGVADMKGGIVVMLAAVQTFLRSRLADELGIEIVINADEEVSSLGSAALLAEAARRCDLGLAYEPSATVEGGLAGGRKGSGNFAAQIRGRAAHAGRNPTDGRNAIVAAGGLASRLAALNNRRPGLSLNPARIEGGGPENVVPDHAILRFNIRVAALADMAWAEAAVREALTIIEVEHDVAVALHGGFSRPPKPLDAQQLRLFELVRDCGSDLGQTLDWRDTGGVCDGNNLAAHGLAVVDTLGVRGGAIHSDQEFLIVRSLVERAQLSAVLLSRLAKRGFARSIAG